MQAKKVKLLLNAHPVFCSECLNSLQLVSRDKLRTVVKHIDDAKSACDNDGKVFSYSHQSVQAQEL
jgi:hypothetical protein